MDIDANLREQLELVASLQKADDAGKSLDETDALRLAELVQAMHEWLAKGRFLPQAWQRQ